MVEYSLTKLFLIFLTILTLLYLAEKRNDR